MQEILLDLLNTYGYAAIGALIFIENLFPPIPSEVILLFGGFMTTYSEIKPVGVIIAATIGSYAGACALYGIGRILSYERLMKLADSKIGRFICLKQSHIEKTKNWFERVGNKAVFICRCVPVVRSLISIPAGITKMSFWLFSVLTVAGSLIWNIVLTLAGHFAGNSWQSWLGYLKIYTDAVIIIIAFAILAFVIYKILKHNATKHMQNKHISPARVIAIGFAAVILTGAVLLFLPLTHNDGVAVSFTDALFTSTSAVCVTGLISIDTAETFNLLGQMIVALLIQIGGLGITSIGVGIIILSGRKIGLRERTLAKEALNYSSFKGVLALVKTVLKMTICFELTGAALSFIVFSGDYPLGRAIWISIFHSIAAFNNSGFDVLGGYQNLIPYQSNIFLNLVTCALIIFGGLGFFVNKEIYKKHSFKKLSLHTKIVVTVTAALLVIGTLMLKLTDNITWLQAFFTSTSARTAGFSTFQIGTLSSAGLFIIIVLMFIGASPGSTGGGIKTTTFFVVIIGIFTTSTNKPCEAFKRRLPNDIVKKSFIITVLSLIVVSVSVFLLTIFEPKTDFLKLLFESVSAFGTVGLSTGITPALTDFAKWTLTATMYIGRLGPLTVASLWVLSKNASVSRAEENITIG